MKREEFQKQEFEGREEAVASLLMGCRKWGMDLLDCPVPNPAGPIMDRSHYVRLIAWGESMTEWVETWEISPSETYFSNKPRTWSVKLINANGTR